MCPLSPKLSPTAPIPGSPTTPDPLHGSFRSSRNRAHAEQAERRAEELFADEEVARLLKTAHGPPRPLSRARDIFVNRNLRMSGIELVGFDMDYTLAIYHMRRLEQLAYDMTLAKLICEKGYPSVIGHLQYDHHFVMRGLAVDRVHGNLLKMDRFGYVGRAWHGLRPLQRETWHALYRNQRVRLKEPRFAWIDTLFALPEAWLFAGIIELLESLGQRVDYGRLYDDIRDAIDAVHRMEPDLIVLDVMLPDIDGFEVASRLRASERHQPILFLTARDSLDDKLKGLTVGGDDYVTKPFSLEEVIARETLADGPLLLAHPCPIRTEPTVGGASSKSSSCPSAERSCQANSRTGTSSR